VKDCEYHSENTNPRQYSHHTIHTRCQGIKNTAIKQHILKHVKPYITKRKQAHWNIPRKAEALTGVDVFGWTLANQAGTTLERPMTHI